MFQTSGKLFLSPLKRASFGRFWGFQWYQPTTLGKLKGFHAKNAKFTTHDLEIPQNSWESLQWTSIRHVSADVWWMLGYRVQLTILGLEKKLTMLATSSSHDYLELQYLIYKPWPYCQTQVTCLLGGWAVFSLDTLLWEQRPGLRGRHGHQHPHSPHSHSVRYLAQYLTIDADYEKM